MSYLYIQPYSGRRQRKREKIPRKWIGWASSRTCPGCKGPIAALALKAWSSDYAGHTLH